MYSAAHVQITGNQSLQNLFHLIVNWLHAFLTALRICPMAVAISSYNRHHFWVLPETVSGGSGWLRFLEVQVNVEACQLPCCCLCQDLHIGNLWKHNANSSSLAWF